MLTMKCDRIESINKLLSFHSVGIHTMSKNKVTEVSFTTEAYIMKQIYKCTNAQQEYWNEAEYLFSHYIK